MKLIGRTVSPYARRLAITMRPWGMRYENEPVPVADQARLRSYNPLGRIPALDPWLCGFGPTIADVTVATSFDFVGATLADAHDLSAWPALGRTAAAVRALPACAETAP